jgi:hypothetical protein
VTRSVAVKPLIAVLLFGATFAHAANDEYTTLVKRANGGDLSLDFRALRLACLKAEQCDPAGETEDIVAARRSMDREEFAKAAKACEKVIVRGFVNIEAHEICAQAYKELHQPGKAQFHHNVASALIRSILASGDGKSEKTAFEVIAVREEYIVMMVLGLPLGSQSVVPGKQHSFDVLERTDPKTGQTIRVYFNIDAFYPRKLD